MNGYLKEVAALCRISKRLTTQMARNTFAATVTLGNRIPKRIRQGNARLFFRLYVAPLYAGSGEEFLKGMKRTYTKYDKKVKGYTPTDVVV